MNKMTRKLRCGCLSQSTTMTMRPRKLLVAFPSVLAALLCHTNAYDISSATSLSRRALWGTTVKALVAGTAVASSAVAPRLALAEEDAPMDVYFGVGCFWHIQHEFVDAERKILKRNDRELTSRTGYAGGSKTDNEGRVCYHNFQRVADYGALG